MLIAANFHYIRDSFDAPYPSIFGVTPEEFARQLEQLGTAGTFVSGGDIVAALEGSRTLPDRAIAVTFDDGLAEQYERAWPILRRLGIPAIFYVNTGCIRDGLVETVHKIHLLRAQVSPATLLDELADYAAASGVALDRIDTSRATVQYRYDTPEIARLKYLLNFALDAERQAEFVDRALIRQLGFDEAATSRALYMTPEQVRALDAEGAIGTHGDRHVVLGRLPEAQARVQVTRSLDTLAGWGCRNVASLSYPYGSHEACPPAAAEAAAAAGLRFAFTMERAINQDLTRPMFLARFSNSDLPGGNAASWTADRLFSDTPRARWHRD